MSENMMIRSAWKLQAYFTSIVCTFYFFTAFEAWNVGVNTVYTCYLVGKCCFTAVWTKSNEEAGGCCCACS